MTTRGTAGPALAPPEASKPAPTDTVRISATEAQSQFGRVFDQAIRDRVVVISKHNAPRAVLISIERYEAMVKAGAAALESLRTEFDELLDRMQTREARSGMQRAFNASARDLGKTAVNEAVRRRRAR